MKKFLGLLVCTGLLMTHHLQSQPTDKIILEKIYEPNQKAFTILKPQGWLTEGGLILWDPIASGGPANCIESKIDFAIKKDETGTVKIHWLPDIYFDDTRGILAAAMFPQGSNYNGMPVLYKMDASAFLKGHVFPYLHPKLQASSADSRELPEVEKLCYDTDILKELGSKYSSAVAEFIYTEDGIKYKEVAFCIVQDMGPYTAGIEQEIQKGHASTNAEINEQAYLNLTDQEDYVNPYTQQVERGSNQWDHRWVDNLGNVIYTNNEVYNPNLDLELQMDGFKRTPTKK